MLVGLTHDFWHHLRGAGVFGGVDRGWSLRSTDDDPLGSRRVRSWRGLEGQGDGPAWEWKSSQRRRVERNLENRLVSTSQPGETGATLCLYSRANCHKLFSHRYLRHFRKSVQNNGIWHCHVHSWHSYTIPHTVRLCFLRENCDHV